MLAFQFNEEPFLLNSVCSGCPLWSLLDVSGEDLICLILTPWGWGSGYTTLIWKGEYMITFVYSSLPLTRTLSAIFLPHQIWIISPNSSREPSRRRKRWLWQCKVASCTVFLRPSASPLYSPVWDSDYKIVFSLAYIRDRKEPEWEGTCLRSLCLCTLFLYVFWAQKVLFLLMV